MNFWTYWRRGWFVLLMVVLMGLFEQLLWSALEPLLKRDQGPYLLVGLALLLLVLPAFAYWLFVLFFGHKAWPFAAREPELKPEERAFALFETATRLESQGRLEDAAKKYQEVMDKFPGTSASRDAQRSLEALLARIA